MYKVDWQSVFDIIYSNYGINESGEWLLNKRYSLRQLQEDIKTSVNRRLLQDDYLVVKIIHETTRSEFLELSSKERQNKILYSHGPDRYGSFDLRTIKKAIISRSVSNNYRLQTGFIIIAGLWNKVIKEKQLNNKLEGDKSSELSLFANSKWKMYYHDYDDYTQDSKLGLAILNINEKLDVSLLNFSRLLSTNYSGSIDKEFTNQHLYIDLHSEPLPHKHLRMTFFIGSGNIYPLLLGLYTNIYSTNSIVSGTVILEKAPLESEILPKLYSFDDQSEVSEEILKYFTKKEWNHLKVPSGVLSISSLKKKFDL